MLAKCLRNKHFFKKPLKEEYLKLKLYNQTFQAVQTDRKFDFLTAIYVFPHFELDDLAGVVRKSYSMLDKTGVFVLVVADEKYLKEKLRSKKDLFIEENTIDFGRKKYREVLHYSEIPEIGKVIDYNREEAFYVDLFKGNKFELESKNSLNDNGFICTVFVFKKK